LTDILPVICAAGGQQEVHLALRSPAKGRSNYNSTEPQAAHLEGFWVEMWLFCWFLVVFVSF
jgi:hypothetical protein